MTKKILSLFLALLIALGVFGIAASAEDVSEPVTEDVSEPQVEGTVHKMSEILAAFKADETYMVQPGDIIELDDTASEVLIVDYFTDNKDGSKSVSNGNYKFFRDNNQTTGYTIKAIGEETSYAEVPDNTGREIDFSNPFEYAFKGWKVTYAYSESNFNQIKFTAVWEIPVLEGWEGFLAMARSYLKTIIDYLFVYFTDMSKRIAEYLG